MKPTSVYATTAGIVLLLSGCAGGGGATGVDETPPPGAVHADLSACPGGRGDPHGDSLRLDELWSLGGNWFRLAPDEAVVIEPLGDLPYESLDGVQASRVQLANTELLRGDRLEFALLPDPLVEQLQTFRPDDAELYFGVARAEPEPPNLSLAVAVDDAAVTSLAGDCNGYTELLREFVESTPGASREVVVDLIENDTALRELSAWLDGPPPVDPTDPKEWASLDPDDRHLGAGTAPPEVLEQTVSASLFLDVDPSDIEAGTLLCTRTEEARGGECYDLGSAGRGIFHVSAFPDEPLTLMIEGSPVGGPEDTTELTDIPPEMMRRVAASAVDEGQLAIRVTGLEAAAAGRRGAVSVEEMVLEEAHEVLDHDQPGPAR